MTSRPSDRGRSEVYAAETATFAHTLVDQHRRFGELVTLGEELCDDPRWVGAGGRRFEVRAARSDARRSYAYQTPKGFVIRLTGHGMNVSTLGHEAAHVATMCRHGEFVADHGPEFRGAHQWVVTLLCGQATAERLARSYRDSGLGVVPFDAGAAGPVIVDRFDALAATARLDALAADVGGPERIGGAIAL